MNFQKADFEAAFGISSQLPVDEKIEIAFAGRSNVGKSSLLNKLFNRKALARVSSVPGKTATINFYSVDTVRFVDLPGYGYAKVCWDEKKRWAELLEGYFNSERDIRLVVLLVDMRHKPTEDDILMMKFLNETDYPYVIVMTKSDKLNKTEYNKKLEVASEELLGLDESKIVPFSTTNGDGLEKLKNILEKAVEE